MAQEEFDRIADIIETAKRIGIDVYRRCAKPRPSFSYQIPAERLDRDRLERLGMEYGEAERRATAYGVWLRNLDRFVCSYCGSDVPQLIGMRNVDHVMPLARGGRHRVENLVPACRRCNSMKRARTDGPCPVVADHMRPEVWDPASEAATETTIPAIPMTQGCPMSPLVSIGPPQAGWDDAWFEEWCRDNS